MVFAIVAIIIILTSTIGIIRFARTVSMGEACNFCAVLTTIGKIDWLSYIFALIIMGVIVEIVEVVFFAIPVVGGLIGFLLTPLIALFHARYLCQVYDRAGPI